MTSHSRDRSDSNLNIAWIRVWNFHQPRCRIHIRWWISTLKRPLALKWGRGPIPDGSKLYQTYSDAHTSMADPSEEWDPKPQHHPTNVWAHVDSDWILSSQHSSNPSGQFPRRCNVESHGSNEFPVFLCRPEPLPMRGLGSNSRRHRLRRWGTADYSCLLQSYCLDVIQNDCKHSSCRHILLIWAIIKRLY